MSFRSYTVWMNTNPKEYVTLVAGSVIWPVLVQCDRRTPLNANTATAWGQQQRTARARQSGYRPWKKCGSNEKRPYIRYPPPDVAGRAPAASGSDGDGRGAAEHDRPRPGGCHRASRAAGELTRRFSSPRRICHSPPPLS